MMEKENYKQLHIEYNGLRLEFWRSVLLAVFSAIISIFSTSSGATNTSTVFVMFIGVLVVLYSLLVNGEWGILTSFLSSLLFCLTIKVSLFVLILNVFANTIQATMLWVFIKKISFKNEKTINMFDIVLLFAGILYLVLGTVYNNDSIVYVFSLAVVVIYLLKSLISKSGDYLKYLFLVCMLPSFVGGFLNSLDYCRTDYFLSPNMLNSIGIWTFSNLVLFSLFGYLLCTFVPNVITGTNEETSIIKRIPGWLYEKQSIKVSVVIYYAATLIWNAMIYGMFLLNWFSESTVAYLIPWMVGNIFFVLNLHMAKKNEIEDNAKEAFKWFEGRAVVAENNTQMLIAIISLLLPISTNIMGIDSMSLAIVSMLNITMAIISIGLIWVPKNNAAIMEIVKNVKTVCHLFTLSLLLLSIFMIINSKSENLTNMIAKLINLVLQND